MTNIQNTKPKYDPEERAFNFAKDVRIFVKTLPKSSANFEDGKQVIKSSGSVDANYREANAEEAKRLIQESNELKKIFSSIVEKSN